MPSGPPLNPLKGSQSTQILSCILFSNSWKMQTFFPSWLTSRSLYLQSQKSISFSYYFYLSMSQAYEAGLSFSHTCSFSDASASLQGLKLFFSYIPILVKYQSINKPVFFIWEDMSQFSQDINTSAFLMHPPDLSYGDLLLRGNAFIKVSFVPY